MRAVNARITANGRIPGGAVGWGGLRSCAGRVPRALLRSALDVFAQAPDGGVPHEGLDSGVARKRTEVA